MNEAQSFACRACGSRQGASILDLGLQPLANHLLHESDVGVDEPRFPLELMLCQDCFLLQIRATVPPGQLFTEYLYFSSYSDAMQRHAREAVSRYHREFGLNEKSLVIEVASNDGYLLKHFVPLGVPTIGIEPAVNIAREARRQGIETLAQFFDCELADQLARQGRLADLVLGNNVFAHVPDINDFLVGLKKILKPSGIIVLEFPYALPLIQNLEFDTIYHEHVFYFALVPLWPLFLKHRLEIFHLETLPIHGGSLRLFIGHAGIHHPRDSVWKGLVQEQTNGVSELGFYRGFGQRVRTLARDLHRQLHKLKRKGHSLAAYGASAKGSILLNFLNPEPGLLDFVVDRNPHKQGRLTPGLHLPILPPEELARRRPDYTLLLTWNFAEEILVQQQPYRDAGGRFIIPLPEFKIM